MTVGQTGWNRYLDREIRMGRTIQRSPGDNLRGLVTTQTLLLPNRPVGWRLGKCTGLVSRRLRSELLCPGGKTQPRPPTSARPRGQRVSHRPPPRAGLRRHPRACPGTRTAREMEEETLTVPEVFLSGLGLLSEQGLRNGHIILRFLLRSCCFL